MSDFPFEWDPSPPPSDLESFSELDEKITAEGAPRLTATEPCHRVEKYVEISLVDLEQLAAPEGSGFEVRVDSGRVVKGTLRQGGVARIENEGIDLEDKTLRVTHFPEPRDGCSYLIEVVALDEDEPADEELLPPIEMPPIPWLPFGEPA